MTVLSHRSCYLEHDIKMLPYLWSGNCWKRYKRYRSRSRQEK